MSHFLSVEADAPKFSASLVVAILFHQLFEGLSLGVRISAIPPSIHKGSHNGHANLAFLKPTLTLLFSITTPVGIVLGLLFLPRGGEGGEYFGRPWVPSRSLL